MDSLTAIQYAMDFYYEITGLRSYFVQGVDEVDSAKEKNFFCKTLKLSSKALDHCDACTLENYTNALSKNEIQMYSCHAGLVKWSVPVEFPDAKGVIISEGVISSQQVADKNQWIDYLVEKYNLPRNILMENYEHIVEMTEKQVDDSVKLLCALLEYYRTLCEE
ncbi:PocR ligand-binding domain-containing protein [uncultured Dubosiella sp.]|uniref:PocR ligand-binding domain-containing protein n=1 Tax=uncultured Dubosiella sp. TaxID=1937011 RepID=UPI002730DC04|nr:PocR ligand-binding domain-containing protein [uncultured Dubosiella sp.]